MVIADFTEDELNRIRHCALTCWAQISPDAGEGLEGDITQEIVIELVLDANRMLMFCDKKDRLLIETFDDEISYDDAQQFFREEVFTEQLYE